MPISRRLPLPAAFAGGIALGLVAALAWTSQAAGRDPAPGSTLDRAAIENLLAERTIQPTGQTRRFELTVVEANVPACGEPTPNMAPEMTDMPGMELMPGMDH